MAGNNSTYLLSNLVAAESFLGTVLKNENAKREVLGLVKEATEKKFDPGPYAFLSPYSK